VKPISLTSLLLLLNLGAETPPTAFLNPHANDGSVLLGELNCVSCHSAGDRAHLFPIRDAPRLANVGARVSPHYLRRFLLNPQATKPGTPMPDLLHALPKEKKDDAVEDLVHFLASMGGPLAGTDREHDQKAVQQGEMLYHTVGCVACHQPFQPAAGFQPKDTDIAEAMKSMPKLSQPSIPLGDLAAKTTVSALADFIEDPLDTREGGRMPSLSLNADEARVIATYLLRAQKPGTADGREGLLYTVFADPKKKQRIAQGKAESITLEALELPGNFSTVEFNGSIEIEADGEYGFFMSADGQYSIKIGNQTIIKGNSKKPGQKSLGAKVKLKKGQHPILVQVSPSNQSKRFKLTWEGPDLRIPEPISAELLSHSSRSWNPSDYSPLQQDEQRVARGRKLFQSVGCASCHNTGSHLKRSYAGNNLVRPGLKIQKFAPRNNRSPGHEDARHAIDGKTKTKYLNFGKEGAGLVIHLSKSPVVISGISLTSANDHEARDPTRYRLEGSNDGKKFEVITEDAVPLFKKRFQTQSLSFTNDASFKIYRITFVQIRNSKAAKCVQIAEVRLFGAKEKSEGLPSELEAKPLAELSGNAAGGCLSAAVAGGRPRFALNEQQTKALTQALIELRNEKAPSASEQVASHLNAFNCYACHARGGRGGIEEGRSLYFTTHVPVDLGEEGRIPPSLDLVGAKFTATGLGQILFAGHGHRSHMTTRMPQFGRPNLEELPSFFAAADAKALPDHQPARATARTISNGRRLVGNKAYGCINCHNWGSNKSLGTPGPDLAQMTRHIRPGWFKVWLSNPFAIREGTRMPNFFPDGKGAFASVLGGDPTKQIDAIWAYLSRGTSARPPEGMKPGDPYVLLPDDEPILFRAFVSGVGAHAITIGYPSGVHLAFDALKCRLAMVWTGDFISAKSSWTGRGGRYTGIGGSDKNPMPAGPTLALLEHADATWPDFKSEAWHFVGYRYDKKRNPILRYRFRGIEIEEHYSAEFGERPRLKRTLNLSASNKVENLFFRLAAGSDIKKEKNVYNVDGKLRFSSDLEPAIRKGAGGQELIAPIVFEATKDGGHTSRLEFVIEW